MKRLQSNWRQTGVYLSAVMLCVFAVGCDRMAPSNASSPQAQQPAAPVWAWNLDWLSDKLPLGRMSCTVRPKKEFVFEAEAAGELYLDDTFDISTCHVQQDQIWARISPEQLERERKSLGLRRKVLELQGYLLEKYDGPQAELELERTRQQAKHLLDSLRELQDNAEHSQLMKRYLPQTTSQLDKVSIELAERVYDLLDDQVEEGPGKLRLDRLHFEEARIELAKTEYEFTQHEKNAQLESPITGTLALSLPDETFSSLKAEPVEIDAGDRIAIVRDLSTLLFEVRITSGDTQHMNPEELFVTARSRRGQSIRGTYHDQIMVEDKDGRSQMLMRFTVDDPSQTELDQMIGMRLSLKLYRKLDKPMYIVPKSLLLSQQADAFGNTDWSDGVENAFGGQAHLVSEGPYHLAIEVSE